jgi:hypothetical protein
MLLIIPQSALPDKLAVAPGAGMPPGIPQKNRCYFKNSAIHLGPSAQSMLSGIFVKAGIAASIPFPQQKLMKEPHMKKSINLIALLLPVLVATAVLAAGEDKTTTIQSLQKTLMEGKSKGLRVDEAGKRAIDELVKISSQDAVDVLKTYLTTPGKDRKLKQQALCGLGLIGTKDAVAAIDDFQKWAEKTNRGPGAFHFGECDHAIDHYAPSKMKPITVGADEKGAQWAVFPWRRYGVLSLWAVPSTGKDAWGRPVLTDMPAGEDFVRVAAGEKSGKGADDFKLSVAGGTFTLSSESRSLSKTLKLLTEDTDKDGLPDAEEVLLGTDPKNPDSDGDGAPDDQDTNPLTPKYTKTDDLTEIRQAVFSMLFATCDSQDAIVLVAKERNAAKDNTEIKPFAGQEYYGFGGIVLRSDAIRDGFVNVTGFDVKIESNDTATASIHDWEGSEAASTHEAKLKKVHDKWVVVEFQLTWIS